MGFNVMSYFLVLFAFLLQSPSLDSASPKERQSAVEQMAVLGNRPAIPQLAAALKKEPKSDVRASIVAALGRIRDPAAGPALEKTMRDPDQKVAQEAILAIGLTAYAPARAVVEQIFRTDPNRTIKSRALEALSLMHDKANIPLFESLLLTDKNDYYRELAAEGLARLQYDAKGWKQVYEQEKKPNVRNALAFGLAAAGDLDYMNDLANGLSGRQAYQVEVYLYELGKYDGKLGELYRYLRSSDPKVRAGIVRIIGNIGDPNSLDQIRPLRDDSNADVVREAVTALRKLSR